MNLVGRALIAGIAHFGLVPYLQQFCLLPMVMLIGSLMYTKQSMLIRIATDHLHKLSLFLHRMAAHKPCLHAIKRQVQNASMHRVGHTRNRKILCRFAAKMVVIAGNIVVF